MTICNNPLMKEIGLPDACHHGELNCCRVCDKAESCLSQYTPMDGTLCPYILKKSDLKKKCPFEIEN